MGNKKAEQVFDNVLFGNRLREAREKRGEKAENLSEWIGMAKSYWSGCENGIKVPSIEKACKMADILDVPVSWLLGFSDDTETKKAPPSEAEEILTLIIEAIEGKSEFLDVRLDLVDDEFARADVPVSSTERKYYRAALILKNVLFRDFITDYENFFNLKASADMSEEAFNISINKLRNDYLEKFNNLAAEKAKKNAATTEENKSE